MDLSKVTYQHPNPISWNKPSFGHDTQSYKYPIIPPKVLIPASLSNQLNGMSSHSEKSRYGTDSRKKKKKVPLAHNYFSSSTLNEPITTTQPPMIWFPGKSDCINPEKEETGKKSQRDYTSIW